MPYMHVSLVFGQAHVLNKHVDTVHERGCTCGVRVDIRSCGTRGRLLGGGAGRRTLD